MRINNEILLADGSNLKIDNGEIVLARYEPGQPDHVLTERDARALILAQPAFYREQGLETLRAIERAHNFELAVGADDVVDPETEADYAGAADYADYLLTDRDLVDVYAGATELAVAA